MQPSTPDFTPVTLRSRGGGTFSAFLREGPTHRSPMVLLHGAGGNAREWMALGRTFADRSVLLVDMPGHGRSSSPSTWDMDDTANCIAEVVGSVFRSGRVLLGGHSWGGKIAGLVAASAPDTASGLVLLDPSPSAAVPIDLEDFVDGIWAAEIRGYPDALSAVEAAREQPHWQPWDDATADVARHGISERPDGTWSLRPKREDLLALCAAVLHVDASERLARAAQVPTLLMIAEESLPWQQFTNAALYAHATQVVIPGNHWIHRGYPGLVRSSIGDWLETLAD